MIRPDQSRDPVQAIKTFHSNLANLDILVLNTTKTGVTGGFGDIDWQTLVLINTGCVIKTRERTLESFLSEEFL